VKQEYGLDKQVVYNTLQQKENSRFSWGAGSRAVHRHEFHRTGEYAGILSPM